VALNESRSFWRQPPFPLSFFPPSLGFFRWFSLFLSWLLPSDVRPAHWFHRPRLFPFRVLWSFLTSPPLLVKRIVLSNGTALTGLFPAYQQHFSLFSPLSGFPLAPKDFDNFEHLLIFYLENGALSFFSFFHPPTCPFTFSPPLVRP